MFPTHSGLSKSIWFGLDELGWFGFSYLFGHLGNFSDFRCGKGQIFLTQKVLDNYPFTLDNLRQMSGKINPILYGCSDGNGSPYQDVIWGGVKIENRENLGQCSNGGGGGDRSVPISIWEF